MTCRCRRDNAANRRYCGGCGVSLICACAGCGFGNALDDRYCGGCGTGLGTVIERAHAPQVVVAAASKMPDELQGLFERPTESAPLALPPHIGQDDLDRLFGDVA